VHLTAIADKMTHQNFQFNTVMQNITWSFSKLKDYINCPKQYNAVYVTKEFPKQMTKEMAFGNKVHKALEDYVKDSTPLPPNYQHYVPQLEPLRVMDGVKYPEYRMGLKFNREPCDFYDKEVWVRGIADLLVLQDDHAFIVDYKTGKVKNADPKQLQLMALMVFQHFPQIKHIDAGLLFVAFKQFITSEYSVDDKENLWSDFEPDLMRMSVSHETDTWQANPSGLCGWCPVKSCEFHKER
jgi:CRISPR/Cas system-associated exonuclease Cas4 (RecB family)